MKLKLINDKLANFKTKTAIINFTKGWLGDSATKRSHIQLKHLNRPHYLVTIPMHNKDLAKGTLFSIIKQLGMTKDDFEKLISM